MPKSIANFSPSRLLALSMLFTIALGSLLLSLPISRIHSLNVIDVIFTATSALCACGLTTISLDNFTFFGQCIILFLMQIGGLTLVTLLLFVFSLFVKFGLHTQLMGGQLLELESWKKFKTMLFVIIGITFITELIGTFIILLTLVHYFTFPSALFFALFHSVSLFCHVGFSLFPDNFEVFSQDYFLLIISSIIILIGGFGFFAWYDVFLYLKDLKKRKRHHLSLHTRLVITVMIITVICSTFLFWMLERNNTLRSFSFIGAFVNTFFNNVASRGTGLYTIPTHELHLATLLLIMVNTFIGESPGSTGSGIKSITVALLYGIVKETITERNKVVLYGRTIPYDQILRAVSIFVLAIVWILLITFFLLITEEGFSFISLLFETVSAFGTLGLSTGITPSLSLTGKILIIICMIVGRIGSLSFILSVQQKKLDGLIPSYPEERVMLG